MPPVIWSVKLSDDFADNRSLTSGELLFDRLNGRTPDPCTQQP